MVRVCSLALRWFYFRHSSSKSISLPHKQIWWFPPCWFSPPVGVSPSELLGIWCHPCWDVPGLWISKRLLDLNSLVVPWWVFSNQSFIENIFYFCIFMCAILKIFDFSQDFSRRNNTAFASCRWREGCRRPDLLFSPAPVKIYGNSGEEDVRLKLFIFGGCICGRKLSLCCICLELALPFPSPFFTLLLRWKIIPNLFPHAIFDENKNIVTLFDKN